MKEFPDLFSPHNMASVNEKAEKKLKKSKKDHQSKT